MKKPRVIHKAEFDKAIRHLCGTPYSYGGCCDRGWRRVTCERCLKLREKKRVKQ